MVEPRRESAFERRWLVQRLASVMGSITRTLFAAVEHVGDALIAMSEGNLKLRTRPFDTDAPEFVHGGKPDQPFGGEIANSPNQFIVDRSSSGGRIGLEGGREGCL